IELGQFPVEVQRRIAQGIVAGIASGRLRRAYGGAGAVAGPGPPGAPGRPGSTVGGSVHEMAPVLAPSRDCTRSAPKWQEKMLPRPTSLAISRRASCRFSTCLTMARPRPVPPDSRERLVETR